MAEINLNEIMQEYADRVRAQYPREIPTPQSYRYLNRGQNVDKDQVLVANERILRYDRDEQYPGDMYDHERIIIRGEDPFRFMRFRSANEFGLWIMARPPHDRAFHEVIPENAPCRLFIDVDGPDVEDHSGVIGQIRAAIGAVFMDFWNVRPLIREFRTRYEDRPRKLSAHFHIPGYVFMDIERVGNVVKEIKARLPAQISGYIDTAPYKSWGSLRAPFCHKVGALALKLPEGFECPGLPEFEQFTISCSKTLWNDKRLIIGAKKKEHKPAVLPSNEMVARALRLAGEGGHMSGLEYSGQKGNMLNFLRKAPGHCKICNRVHDNDNTLYVTIGAVIRARCLHNPGQSIILGPGIEPIADPWLSAPNVSRAEIDRKELGALPDFHDVLAVRSLMGTGKTKALITWLARLKPAQIVIILSFRLTFTRDLAQKLPGFQCYNEIKGKIDPVLHSRLIVQVESIHRLDITKLEGHDFTLIMDESESILGQWTSGNIKNFNESWAKFNGLMRASNRIIVMDAFVGARTLSAINELRPGARISLLDNKHRPDDRGSAIFMYSEDNWLGKMTAFIDSGKKIVVPCNALSGARKLHQILRAKYPGKDIAIYSSETDPDVKARIFNDVNTEMLHDVLIYTPTLSAGVSFERAHYDVKFAYYCTSGADYMTIMQMLGRVRNTTLPDIYIYIHKISCRAPITEEELIRAIMTDGETIYLISGATPIDMDYTNPLRPKPRITPWVKLCAHNTLVKNQSRISSRYLVHLLRISGYDITFIKEKAQAIKLPDINVNEYAEAISGSDQIDEYEYRDLLDKQRRVGLSLPESLSMRKYLLQRLYQKEVIGPEFIKKYGRPEIIEIYKNRAQESDDKRTELGRRYHDPGRLLSDGREQAGYLYAKELLQTLGWTNYNSTQIIPKDKLFGALDKWISGLSPDKKLAVQNKFEAVLERKTTDTKKKLINKILGSTYDVYAYPINPNSNGPVIVDGTSYKKRDCYQLVPGLLFGAQNEPLL
ncbi:MAG: hypothetical protein ACYC3F_16680 [Gemmatimonadaceae bacterium]